MSVIFPADILIAHKATALLVVILLALTTFWRLAVVSSLVEGGDFFLQ